ncbi:MULTISPECIES: HD-GYP domain-containing protein [Clostridium]|uniref:HD-GYP domain-containing protein n=1 Tax=Clostridium TaxID=1485 RepID=UPI00073D990D|nr:MULTISPECIES: HD-GYP domain-containing protein [Clostridium]UZQ48934.1 HD-GYP domain-containing protein [Clostridium kluyveri]
MKKVHYLTKNFIAYSFIACFITAIMLIAFISFHVKKDKISSEQKMIHLTLHYIVEPELNVEDFQAYISEPKSNLLDSKLQPLIDDGTISYVRIWNREKRLIYSSNDKKTNIDNNSLEKALKNNITYMITNDSRKVIKFYLPINYNNKTVATYEVVKSYSDIKFHIRELTIIISLSIFLGLLLLYLLLIRVINNSSKTLIKQNQDLAVSKLETELAYSKLNESYKHTIIALSNSIDARDPYTAGHSERVARLSLDIGKELGLNKDKLDTLEIAALLHDIGKIGISDDILHKTGRLNEYEYEKIKEHPSIGVNILKDIDFLKNAVPFILHHHERFDGYGYPLGIKGYEIPLEARIIAVADSYDAMVSDRPYRRGLSQDIAISELIKFKNIQFDGSVVDAFLKIYKQNKEELAYLF